MAKVPERKLLEYSVADQRMRAAIHEGELEREKFLATLDPRQRVDLEMKGAPHG